VSRTPLPQRTVPVPESEGDVDELLVDVGVDVPEGVPDGVPCGELGIEERLIETGPELETATLPLTLALTLAPSDNVPVPVAVTTTDPAGNPAGQLYLRTLDSPADAANNPNPVAKSYVIP